MFLKELVYGLGEFNQKKKKMLQKFGQLILVMLVFT